MLDRPWVRLVLGALAAALLGAMAARVAVSAAGGDGAGTVASRAGGASSRGGGSGSFTSGGGASGDAGSSSDASGGSGDAGGSSGGATATLSGGSGRVTVHVTGEVRRPGVYALREGDRVNDAVKRAGGATRAGDRQALNLAAPVRDGQQVRVPPRVVAAGGSGTSGGSGAAGGGGTGSGGGSGGGAAGSGGAAGAAGGAAAAPVDLNTATLEELQTLDGVGPTTAEKILKLRDERGGLSGVDDLDEVPGIGPKKLEALRAQLGG